MTRPRLPTWLLGAATLVAASCGTPRPKEHLRPPATATGGGPAFGSGGSSPAGSGASTHLGGADLGGASSASGGSSSSGSGGSGTVGSGAGGSGGEPVSGSGGTTPDYDCDAPRGDTPAFSRQALRSAAAECVQYYYCRFEGAATTLSDSVEDLALDPSAEHSAAAKAAWLGAFREWAVLEVMQFGPAASASPTAGKDVYQGHGVRDLIDSWPQISRCRVDEQVAQQSYQQFGVEQALISARGLLGIETLLYYEGFDTECGASTATAATWSGLDAATIGQRRRDYAHALADDVLGQAQGLAQTWSSGGGDFEQTFVSASGYPDEQEAMNVLGWSLLYIEREVKDWKLGVPAGYTTGAPVSAPEARFAGEQSALLAGNIEGFRRLFQGCGPSYSGVGFDDWLVEAGHADLATDILQASALAEGSVAGLARFPDATPAELQSTYAVVKALTDLLKADLFGAGSPINLKLPASLEGDTD